MEVIIRKDENNYYKKCDIQNFLQRTPYKPIPTSLELLSPSQGKPQLYKS
jgi:hypothetical protein